MSRQSEALQIQPAPEVSARFWAKVDVSAGGAACWLWLAGVDHCGYGQFGVPVPGARTYFAPVKAHRFAYRDRAGPIPAGMVVMHACDTPACVNPAHLSLGTAEDNRRDMQAKGRAWWQRRRTG